MTFKNLFIKHERSAEEEAWVEEEIAEQEARFAKIEQSMEDIKPQRAKWYASLPADSTRMVTTKWLFPATSYPFSPKGVKTGWCGNTA